MSTSTILFWLVLLVDLFSYIVILMIGIAMACLLYYFTDGTIHPSHYEGYLTQYAGAFLLACICAHNKRRLENLKLQAASALGASVAHEMRSPLMILQDSFSGIKRYLPRLLNGYTLAKDAGLAVEPIRADHLKSVEAVLQDTDGEIQYANTIIDMLLVNVDQHAIKQAKLTTCSMAHCIDTAIRRYPFDPKSQVELIHLDQESGDFEFKGTEILMVHVLFNLIKNAIYFIEETKKGEIYITLEKGPKYNTLYFKDTGPGIPPHILPQLFNRFFTTTPNGTGLGLAFCKMAMEGFGGSIKCISEYGSYTQFTLAFPIMQKT